MIFKQNGATYSSSCHLFSNYEHIYSVIMNTPCKYSIVKKVEKELRSERGREIEVEEKIKGDR